MTALATGMLIIVLRFQMGARLERKVRRLLILIGKHSSISSTAPPGKSIDVRHFDVNYKEE